MPSVGEGLVASRVPQLSCGSVGERGTCDCVRGDALPLCVCVSLTQLRAECVCDDFIFRTLLRKLYTRVRRWSRLRIHRHVWCRAVACPAHFTATYGAGPPLPPHPNSFLLSREASHSEFGCGGRGTLNSKDHTWGRAAARTPHHRETPRELPASVLRAGNSASTRKLQSVPKPLPIPSSNPRQNPPKTTCQPFHNPIQTTPTPVPASSLQSPSFERQTRHI